MSDPIEESAETPDAIEKSIELNAPVSRVWRALTDHREFGEWFRVKLESPFEVGKEAQGNVLHPGYEHVVWKAVVQEIRKPELFSFTWYPYAIDPNVDYSGEQPTLVEFRLRPTATGTRLTVTESGFSHVPAHRRADAFRMNDGGWTQQVKNIKNHVES
jgi:uncharacterized protein YndB with AHSA1/START domain